MTTPGHRGFINIGKILNAGDPCSSPRHAGIITQYLTQYSFDYVRQILRFHQFRLSYLIPVWLHASNTALPSVSFTLPNIRYCINPSFVLSMLLRCCIITTPLWRHSFILTKTRIFFKLTHAIYTLMLILITFFLQLSVDSQLTQTRMDHNFCSLSPHCVSHLFTRSPF